MRAHVEVRPGAYHDSVTLMQVSQAVGREPGVEAALVAMGTTLNLDLAEGMGFPRPQAGPSDLIVALRTADQHVCDHALAVMEQALSVSDRSGPASVDLSPRTVRTAAARGGSTVALISVPGPHAFIEAMEALEAGLHTMIFSDNVPVAEEIALKDAAVPRGLLVMGPDCGTAIVGGVAFGFANVVRRGSVGIVAASGTGAQQVCCLLDIAGVGVSHVLGVGGRDLLSEVGGRSTVQALQALDADPATEVIVVVSKPAGPDTASRLAEVVAGCGKPVVMAVLGASGNDFTAATEEVLGLVGAPVPIWPTWGVRPPTDAVVGARLRGLFAGGTLCDEAMVIASEALGEIRSNIPLRPEWQARHDATDGHVMTDFGDDAMTAGRPHPMIDPGLRLDRLSAEAASPSTGVVLVDVVLGYGAHQDPASDLASAIATARHRSMTDGRSLEVVASICGTAADPQSLHRQAEMLAQAGAQVFLSNAAAARHAVKLVTGEKVPA